MKSIVKEYENAIKAMLKLKGVEATNSANHMALNNNMISLELFQAGARIIAKEALK